MILIKSNRHYSRLVPEHRIAQDRLKRQPYEIGKNACGELALGIYSRASLAPLFSKVRQAEMEADDCEGRLPPLISDVSVRSLRLGRRDVRQPSFPNPS